MNMNRELTLLSYVALGSLPSLRNFGLAPKKYAADQVITHLLGTKLSNPVPGPSSVSTKAFKSKSYSLSLKNTLLVDCERGLLRTTNFGCLKSKNWVVVLSCFSTRKVKDQCLSLNTITQCQFATPHRQCRCGCTGCWKLIWHWHVLTLTKLAGQSPFCFFCLSGGSRCLSFAGPISYDLRPCLEYCSVCRYVLQKEIGVIFLSSSKILATSLNSQNQIKDKASWLRKKISDESQPPSPAPPPRRIPLYDPNVEATACYSCFYFLSIQ